MAIQKRAVKIGGSLGVTLPRDFAQSAGIKEGTPLRLTLVGRQIVIEPGDDVASDEAFHRAHAAVLRRHEETFRFLADYDRGEVK